MNNTTNQEPTLGSKENPFIVSTVDELLSIKSYRYIKYNCKKCNKENIVYKDPRYIEKLKRLLCTQCAIKDTMVRKYGVEHALQSDKILSNMQKKLQDNYGVDNVSKLQEIKDKKMKTCLEHFGETTNAKLDSFKSHRKEVLLEKYGVENAFESDEIKQKIKQTNLKKYGFESPMKNVEVKQKAVNTNNKRYGVDYPMEFSDFVEKGKQTSISKYGVPRAIMRPDVLEKVKASNLEKYGVEYPSKLESVKEKMKSTCMEKYGAPNFCQSDFYRNYPRKYMYDNIYFDSSWELAFYVYHKALGHHIIREPKRIEYEYNGKTHFYFPDFEVDGMLYEIKGSQFFNEDGTMCNPYNHDLDGITEAKHQCGLMNNVIFIGEVEIKPIMYFIKEKMGYDFFKKALISL